MVKGVKLSEEEEIIKMVKPRKEIRFSGKEEIEMEGKINEFLNKNIIQKVQKTTESKTILNSVISNVFLRPKPDGSKRLILNLRNFNELLEKKHFKMDSLTTVCKLITKDCFFLQN